MIVVALGRGSTDLIRVRTSWRFGQSTAIITHQTGKRFVDCVERNSGCSSLMDWAS